MENFIKKFAVSLTVCVIIAGAVLSRKLFGMNLGSYLLYSLVPLVLSMLFFAALFEKKAGVLAFSVVALALFAYLLLIEKKMPRNFYILSGIGAGLGAIVYFFQIKE